MWARLFRPHIRLEMQAAISDEWSILTLDDYRKYIESMPARLAIVIASGGGHTRY